MPPGRADGRRPRGRGTTRQVQSFPVSKVEREQSRLGGYIARRMRELGMTRQVELVHASGLSESLISRIFTQPNYFPNHESLEQLARGLQVRKRDLILFAYDLEDDEPTPEIAENIHPLAVELSRMLDPESPLTDDDRNALNIIIDRVIAPHRRDMRRRRPA